MRIPSIEKLRNTKQPFSTANLKGWAEEAGFTLRRSGGGSSHIRCVHKKYPDIAFNIIADTDKVSTQRDFANVLEEIARRDFTKSFENATKKQQAILAKIPDHLHGRLDPKTGFLVVTDRQIPQLGITIQPEDFHLIENKIHNMLEPRKRSLFTLMNQARMIYDIDIVIPRRGTFDGVLSHPVYGLTAVPIPNYKAGDDTDQCSDMISKFIEQVIEKDRQHAERLDRILGMPFVQEIDVVSHARRGDRTYVVQYESPKHKPLKIEFHGYSHQRVSHDADKDMHQARMTDIELASLEKCIFGVAHGHAQAAYEARL